VLPLSWIRVTRDFRDGLLVAIANLPRDDTENGEEDHYGNVHRDS
jgi:hypothetical protein